MDEEIYDVILQTTGNFRTDIRSFQENLPPKEDFILGEDFWVGRLPHNVSSKLVFDACEPAGFNFHPVRQYGMHYAFCRLVRPDSANSYTWDNDLKIGITLFLSRLIRPTTISTCYSARLFFQDAELTAIVAGPTQGAESYVWVVAKDDWRDWLSVPELERLRTLSAHYSVNAHDRLRQARKHIDHAFHTYYLDQRFASLVTSFESLLKTSQYKSTRQFALRVPKFAMMLGQELTSAEAKAVYEDRSAFVHGTKVSFKEVSDQLIERYDKFERVLRSALLRASTEPAFAELFISEESIERVFGDIPESEPPPQK